LPRPPLEVADIFRRHGPAWRRANAGHVSLGQLKVMSAIERCRTAALGGHVARCEACAHTEIAYNSCRNRHCPKCQGAAAREWLAEREGELLPVPYYHVVFTLPALIGDLAYHNKAVVYDLLFKAAAKTLLTIAADPKHLGARIGLTAVLHSWGSAHKRNSVPTHARGCTSNVRPPRLFLHSVEGSCRALFRPSRAGAFALTSSPCFRRAPLGVVRIKAKVATSLAHASFSCARLIQTRQDVCLASRAKAPRRRSRSGRRLRPLCRWRNPATSSR
jgi:hypothetical protein